MKQTKKKFVRPTVSMSGMSTETILASSSESAKQASTEQISGVVTFDW